MAAASSPACWPLLVGAWRWPPPCVGPYPLTPAEVAGGRPARLGRRTGRQARPSTRCCSESACRASAPRSLVGAALAAAGASLPEPVPQSAGVARHPGRVGRRRARRRARHLPVAAGRWASSCWPSRRPGHRGRWSTSWPRAVRGRDPVLVLVLAGVVVGALAGSIISLLKVLADPYDQLPAITFWLLGSLAGHQRRRPRRAPCPIVLLGLVPLAAAALADRRAVARRRGGQGAGRRGRPSAASSSWPPRR